MEAGVVLLVDDDPDDRELMADLLDEAGYAVIEAHDGEVALELAREHRPDLIIADILMPRINGYEFVRRLREEPEVGLTRVIFCTAHYLEGEVRDLAASCGVSQLISKPFTRELVLGKLSESFEGAPSLGPRVLPEPDFEHEQLRAINDKRLERVAELERLVVEAGDGRGSSWPSAHAAPSALVGVVYEDLRQGVDAIGSHLDLLSQEGDDPEVVELVESAAEAVRSAAQRLQQFALERGGLGAQSR